MSYGPERRALGTVEPDPSRSGTREGRSLGRTNRKEAVMARKMIDCRRVPNEIECTLTIAGQEDEVLDAAVAHAVAKHGHDDTPELRDMIRAGLEDAERALA
jgi:predicted small metal-binding protein